MISNILGTPLPINCWYVTYIRYLEFLYAIGVIDDICDGIMLTVINLACNGKDIVMDRKIPKAEYDDLLIRGNSDYEEIIKACVVSGFFCCHGLRIILYSFIPKFK